MRLLRTRRTESKLLRRLGRLWDRVRYFYWKTVPYDYRPIDGLWYRFKCWIWHRYTTVKPRYLDHTWRDRCVQLPHMMFEILSRFVEEECSLGNIEWYGEYGHKVVVDGTERYVRDELQDLYDWWHTFYQKEYPKRWDALWDETFKHEPTKNLVPIDFGGDEVSEEDAVAFRWDPRFKTEEDKKLYKHGIDAVNALDREVEAELRARLHRLVNVIPHMWT